MENEREGNQCDALPLSKYHTQGLPNIFRISILHVSYMILGEVGIHNDYWKEERYIQIIIKLTASNLGDFPTPSQHQCYVHFERKDVRLNKY